MSNRLAPLLDIWFKQKDECQWVLASIIETKGSSYRKAGAIMLFNSLGKSYGLLSGGCLESDLLRQAQKCITKNSNISVCYDMQDEADIAWQLGIGCGGLVKVLLQPILKNNNYLDLIKLKDVLAQRKQCTYQVNLESSNNHVFTIQSEANLNSFFNIKIFPTPSLIVFGGGIDSKPLIKMANTLGWDITLIDSRPGYARNAYFKEANAIIKQNYKTLTDDVKIQQADAIVIMHHNVSLDAQALNLANDSKAKYIGLLGPQHRTEKVFSQAGLTPLTFKKPLANPIGLDLGGELPESIALSILSQAHAKIENSTAKSLGFYQQETIIELAYSN
ncbi:MULTISPECIES: XdhC family protein [unclassified Pseudoalteromonas]|uniref:XdhC family protein n=1 Tax=unclassified Pseudoalteromonas TaxID=194690 RepID=UPI0005A76DDA|nr:MULTISPECIES: XdhC/CoxI family protein [unclassified Pseudoalteromonas]